MRVIINGIEKFPQFCGECFLMSGETCECSVPGIERTCNPYDGRYDDCPMSPLKAHGKLGDLDALFKQVTIDEHFSVREAMYVQSLISNAPTIIPAEPFNNLSKPCKEGET